MDIKYKESDVVDLHDAMKKKAEQVLSMVGTIVEEATSSNFGMYDDFVKRVSDFDTLSILVDTRLKNLVQGSNTAGNLQDQYNKLRVAVIHGQVRAGLKFLYVCTSSFALPLGAQDLFSSELRRLYRSKEEMALPKFKTLLDDKAMRDMSVAELILQEIIEKAPSLLDFDAD